ncbi:MAG: hypothetical protein D4R68_00890 [Ignavibacteriales bacterium]|nr:MAG: hypothetical protein D4R68_00890 [Ignavibacteriales bacterium]
MKSVKIFLIALTLIASSSIMIFAQEHQHGDHSKMEMKKDSLKPENIVHQGVIDLKGIDKNKDGKVFQDQMDWNVISDKPGKCPLCKMTLKEVTVKKAKKNLLENGFKVK